MIVLHTLKLDKDYSQLSDEIVIQEIKPISEYGLTDGFYGGAVTHIATLKDNPIYLLIDLETDGLQIKDTAIKDFEVDPKILREVAKSKELKHRPVGVTKEELVALIEPYCLKVS
jgi:hypothetical protein